MLGFGLNALYMYTGTFIVGYLALVSGHSAPALPSAAWFWQEHIHVMIMSQALSAVRAWLVYVAYCYRIAELGLSGQAGSAHFAMLGLW